MPEEIGAVSPEVVPETTPVASVTAEKTGDAGVGDQSPQVVTPKESTSVDKEKFAWAQIRREKAELKTQYDELQKKHEESQATIQAYNQYFNPPQAPAEKPLTANETAYLVQRLLDKNTIGDQMEKAQVWLLNQEDVQTKEHFEQIEGIMKEDGLDHLLNVKPLTAYKYAYQEWKNQRASQPSNGVKREEKLASGVPASPSAGQRSSITKQALVDMPIQEYIKLSPAEREARWTQAAKAEKSKK